MRFSKDSFYWFRHVGKVLYFATFPYAFCFILFIFFGWWSAFGTIGSGLFYLPHVRFNSQLSIYSFNMWKYHMKALTYISWCNWFQCLSRIFFIVYLLFGDLVILLSYNIEYSQVVPSYNHSQPQMTDLNDKNGSARNLTNNIWHVQSFTVSFR